MTTLAWIVAGYALLFAAGAGVLARLAPGRRAERLALALPVGAGALSLALFWLGVAAPGWLGRVAVLGLGLALAALGPCFGALRRRCAARAAVGQGASGGADAGGPGGARPDRAAGLRWTDVALLAVLALEVLGVAGAALARDAGNDGFAVFGLKARVVLAEGGIPLEHLRDASRAWSHLDYPWLVPLAEASFLLLGGEWRTGLAKAFFPGVYAALLAFFAASLARGLPRTASLGFAAALGLLPSVARWAATGYADLTLALFWLGSAVSLHAWLRDGARRDLLVAVALAALAAWTKREGLVYAAIQAVAVALSPLAGRTRREAVTGLATLAAAVALVVGPWLVLLAAAGAVPSVDFAAAPHPGRLRPVAGLLAAELGTVEHWGLLWPLFGVAAALALLRRDAARAYLVACVTLGLVAFSACYVWSAWDPWPLHATFALERLVLQQAPLAAFVVAVELGPVLARRSPGETPPGS